MLVAIAFVMTSFAPQEVVDTAAIRAILPKEAAPFSTSKFAHSFRHSPNGGKIAFLDADPPAPAEGAPEFANEANRLDWDRVRAKYRVVVTGKAGGDQQTIGAADLGFDNTSAPAWRADSAAIALTTYDPYIESQLARVLVADVATGERKSLFEAKGGPIVSPAWSHAGARLAVVQVDLPQAESTERGARILVLGADGKPERTIELPKTPLSAFVAWSPDDSYLVAVSGTQLVTVSMADGEIAKLGEVGTAEVPDPCIRFAANGERFALPCDRGIAVVEVATRSLRTIDLGGTGHALVFRPGANFLAVVIITRPEQSLRDAASAIRRAGDGVRHYHHIPMVMNVSTGVATTLGDQRFTDERRYLRIEDRPRLAAMESLWGR